MHHRQQIRLQLFPCVLCLQLLSKGNIVMSNHFTSSQPSHEHQMQMTVTEDIAQQLSPSARINVWYLTEHNEMITDSLELSVDGAIRNDVCTRWTALIPKFKVVLRSCLLRVRPSKSFGF